MRRILLYLAAMGLFFSACLASSSAGTQAPVPTLPPNTTTTTPTTITTSVATTTTTTTELATVEVPWEEWVPEKHLENYLAALAAGAYEQAGFSMMGAGIGFGDNADILPTDYLTAACQPDWCNGPYRIEKSEPYLQYDGVRPPQWNFTVTHIDSGQAGDMTVGMFEGQFVIADLPPLVPSPDGADLLTQLFGDQRPDYVVVERFEGFEIWYEGSTEWVTNWFADRVWQIEGDNLSTYYAPRDAVLVGPIKDPQNYQPFACPDLVIRDTTLLVYEACDASSPALIEFGTNNQFKLLADPSRVPQTEDEQLGQYRERGGVAVVTFGDAEGNVRSMIASTGADLIGDDYAGIITLSANGHLLVYTDHSENSAAYSHWWSPTVVARRTSDGSELARFEIDGPATCLESDGSWVVVCEGDIDRMIGGDPGIVALVAYNIETGETIRIATGTRLFLPSKP